MTIKECIDIVDNIKPNQYTIKEKVMWLSFIDEIIINEVLKTHDGYDGRYDDFKGYSEDKLSVPLIVSSPYDRLYTAYLKMKIDQENGETARYNNSAALYNAYMLEYRKYYNKTHMPLNATDNRDMMPSRKNTIGLSDAEYESLKRDVIAALDDIVYTNTSPDKIYDVVIKYVGNNIELLKGKDGYTPIKGTDYWTDKDIAEVTTRVDEKLSAIQKKVDLLYAKSLVKTVTINLLASAWVEDRSNQFSQVVVIADITPYSKVDLQPTTEQLLIFYEKDIAFVTENDDGVVTVYCIGQKPINDYSMQATITEVDVNG
jgi:hypothetical protein